MREFEAADLPRNRPGECAFLMAEQSLSSKPVGMAAQFILTKACWWRGLS